MHMPSAKKILLVAFILVLLVAIPLTIYLISQQQKSQNSVVPSTTLSFTPATQTVNVGDSVNYDISVDPGTNTVSFIKLVISYDETKLATSGAGFVPNSTVFPSIIQGPSYQPGTISITMSVGASGQSIKTPTKIGTVSFSAVSATQTAPTQLTFGNQTQVLSASGANQFNQNILSTTSPATVNIVGPAPTPTPIETPIPTPLSGASAGATATTSSQLTTSSSTGPTCISFTADRPTTGTAPFNVNFTLVASDSAATITKATFDFGDGQVKELTQADGIGPTTVNALTSHIYNTSGTFTAVGSITDANGSVSASNNCSIIVTVSQATIASASTATGTAQTTPVPSPLPATGSNILPNLAVFGGILVGVGIILLLAL